MSKDFLFIHSKCVNNKILIPDEITIGKKSIVGIYLNSCIRFYKKEINYRLIKERNALRVLCASSQDFDVIDNKIDINTKDALIKEYNFKDGVIFVNGEEYFDIVEKIHLSFYLGENYFRSINKEIILGNEKTLMPRFTNEKPPIKIKLLNMNKKTTI